MNIAYLSNFIFIYLSLALFKKIVNLFITGKVYQDCLVYRILLSMKLKRFSDALHDLHLCLKEKLDPEQK